MPRTCHCDWRRLSFGHGRCFHQCMLKVRARAACPLPAPSAAPPKYESPRPACNSAAVHESETPPAGSADHPARLPGTVTPSTSAGGQIRSPFPSAHNPSRKRQMKAVQLHPRMKVAPASSSTMRARRIGSARCASTSTIASQQPQPQPATRPQSTSATGACARTMPETSQTRLPLSFHCRSNPYRSPYSLFHFFTRFTRSAAFLTDAECRRLLGTDASAD